MTHKIQKIDSSIRELKLDKDLYEYKSIRNRISSLKNNLVTVKAYFNNPELIQFDKNQENLCLQNLSNLC